MVLVVEVVVAESCQYAGEEQLKEKSKVESWCLLLRKSP